MTLIITNKNLRSPAALEMCCRQIELWANGGRNWHPLTLLPNWSSLSGGPLPAYLIDPFGFVHFRGFVTYSGTINSMATQNIASIPNAYCPKLAVGETFPATNVGAVQVTTPATNASGFLRAYNNSAANITNPTCTLSQILYGTWGP